jgi:hypothetical protein
MKRVEKSFVVCTNNKGYPASPEIRIRRFLMKLLRKCGKSASLMNRANTISIRRTTSLQFACRKRRSRLCLGPGKATGAYFPANSFLTASLTTFPSTRMPWAANFAIAVFITVPMSFMVGEPISAMAAFTPAVISASPAALGK